jgi:hypothetical protein
MDVALDVRGARRTAARVRLTTVALLCVMGFACLVGMIGPQSSQADVLEFGEQGSGAGEFAGPEGIAVDNGDPLQDTSAGDVYVVDDSGARVEKFSAEGAFLLAWGWGVADGAARLETCGPAASPPTRTCLPGLEGPGSGEFEAPNGIAVDNSGGLSQGDVYVEDGRNLRIEKFTPDGQFLLMFGGEVNKQSKGDVCVSGEECQAGFEAEGPVAGAFQRLHQNAIAVDDTGTVYVGDNERVQEFGEDGVVSGEVPLAGAGPIGGLAVDASKHLSILGREQEGVHVYDSSGAELGSPRDTAANFFSAALTLGPSDELFVDNGESQRVEEFSPAGTQIASFPVLNDEGAVRGLAFGAAVGKLYILDKTLVRLTSTPPSGPLAESAQATPEPVGAATITATIDPEGAQTTYHFEYGPEQSAETETESLTLAGEGFEPEAVEVKLHGLQPGAAYHFHVVAENANGTSSTVDQVFTELPAAAIDSESVSEVTATSAVLHAAINPLTLPTTYRFEYGTSTAYETSVPSSSEAEVGAGSSDEDVAVSLEHLTPATTYHFRVVTRNSFGQTLGSDHTFTTSAGAAPGLIDGRAWEMVSPPEKHGAALEAMTLEGGAIEAAEDGGLLAYIARAPVSGETAGNRSFASEELLATREGAGTWSTENISTPSEEVAGLGTTGLSEYKFFSSDLSGAVVEPQSGTLLSPQASERTPYVREDGDGLYVPLVSGCPPLGQFCPPAVAERANVPPGTSFALKEEPSGEPLSGTGVQFVAASPDLQHVVVEAPQALTPGFEGSSLATHDSLYEWSASTGGLVPVSVLPDGSSAVQEGGAVLGNQSSSARNALSANGDRAFFATDQEHHLYARDIGEERTVQLDVPEAGLPQPLSSPPAVYQDASSDGSRVFFTDEKRLTTDAKAKENAPDLYMCDVAAVSPGELDCSRHLQDLSVVVTPDEAAEVLGAVIGTSEDGSYVYFVANGVLSNEGVPVAGAVHGTCAGFGVNPEGLCNLYAWHEGEVRLVAVLSNLDFPTWAGSNGADLTKLASRVSPDGRFLAFMSQRSLTGYDNVDESSGQPDEEVFEYGAGSGRVVCASCDPSGGRPTGVFDPSSEDPSLLVDGSQAWAEHWLAATLPGWTAVKRSVALYQSRYLDDEGRLFFDSSADLVPDATNAKPDVYEFEPHEVGGCRADTSSADATFVGELAGSPVDGCIGLVSSGTSSGESAFLDASGRGPGGGEAEDVFFLSPARLSPADIDEALDVYDAHVCSGVSPCPAGAAPVGPACPTVESCGTAPAQQQPEAFGPPAATAILSGPGNVTPAPVAVKPPKHETAKEKLAKALKVCRRKRDRRQRLLCERTERKRYAPKPATQTRKGKTARKDDKKGRS